MPRIRLPEDLASVTSVGAEDPAAGGIAGGFLLDEVVRRAAGQDLRAVLAQEIAEPLRFRWLSYGVAAEDLPQVALDYATGPSNPGSHGFTDAGSGSPPTTSSRCAAAMPSAPASHRPRTSSPTPTNSRASTSCFVAAASWTVSV